MKQTMARRRLAFGIAAVVCAALTTTTAAAQTIQGRWKLLAAEDLRADGSVARYPWGRSPVGSIVVDGGWCYIQIMSSDTPSFGAKAATSVGEQMKSALLSTYIAYSGTCATDDAAERWFSRSKPPGGLTTSAPSSAGFTGSRMAGCSSARRRTQFARVKSSGRGVSRSSGFPDARLDTEVQRPSSNSEFAYWNFTGATYVISLQSAICT
jgi:Lipocalin-like domain